MPDGLNIDDSADSTLERQEEGLTPAQFYRSLISVPAYLEGDPQTLLKFDYMPIIKESDIDKRFIYRYFARQSNLENGEIIEINESKYNDIKNVPLYVSVRIPWRISGRVEDVAGSEQGQPTRLYTGVETANKEAIVDGNRKLPGLDRKLVDPLQFYQHR